MPGLFFNVFKKKTHRTRRILSILILLILTIGLCFPITPRFQTEAIGFQESDESPVPSVTTATITSAKVKNGKLQVTGSNFATGDKIEVDGKLFSDTTNKSSKPTTTLISKSAGSLANGSYIITARSSDQSRTPPFIFDHGVQNGIPKVTISVTPGTLQLTKGQQVQLAAKALDAAGGELTGVSFTWATTNSTLATVDPTGKVTALATGKVSVSATALRNQGQAEVEVKDLPTGKNGVQIITQNPVANEGQSIILEAKVTDAAGQPIPGVTITWRSDSPDIATVDVNGRVQALTRGFATIKASADIPGNNSDSVTVTVARVETNNQSGTSDTGSVTVDNSNRVYQTDLVHQVVRRGPFGQPLELYAGIVDTPGRIDGSRLNSRFNGPLGITVDNNQGNIYVADSANNTIRCLGSDDTVRTVTGNDQAGSTDGTLDKAQFRSPQGVLADTNGDLFIADTENHTIRYVNMKKGTVTTLAGSPGQAGTLDGQGTAARFTRPQGLAFDTTGRNIVVADTGNNLVRLVSRKGEVVTVGTLGSQASEGRATSKRRSSRHFQPADTITPISVSAPKAVSVDAFGNIYVAEQAGGVRVILKSRGKKYQLPINVAQPQTFTKADCVSVLGTNIYVLDAGDKQQNLKRVTLAPPEINKVDPPSSALSGGLTVNVKGRNFAPDTDVLLDGQSVDDLKVDNATQLHFTVPPAIASGVRTLTVQHRGGIDQSPFFYDPPDLNTLPTGAMTTIAGGSQFGGDGGLASKAVLADPRSVTVDAMGNIFFADTLFNRIRRVDVQSKIITTIAGTGRLGFSGDGDLATAANLNYPESLAADAIGNLYLADRNNGRIRRVDAATNIITTIAGGGNPSDGVGDGPALSARLEPRAIVLDQDNNLYIADQANLRIRKLDLNTGRIITVAGGGFPPDKVGDGGSPLAAHFEEVGALAIDQQGKLLVGDPTARRVRIVDQSAGIIFSANLSLIGSLIIPTSLDVDKKGGVLIGMSGRVFRYTPASGNVEAVDLNGAQVGNVRDVTTDGFGNIYIADDGDFGIDRGPGRIIRLAVNSDSATTYAGGGDSVGDGRIPTGAFLEPNDCFVARNGDLYISDGFNNRIRKATLAGQIVTVAGGGKSDKGSLGDGNQATKAVLREPQGIVFDLVGNAYIADSANRRIREIIPDGRITTIAGTGEIGIGGDGGPGLKAQFMAPFGLSIDLRSQTLFIVDVGLTGSRIRTLDLGRNGFVTTVVGLAPSGFSGDGGPAKAAQVSRFTNVVTDAEGNIYFADTGNHRIRRIDSKTNIITTIAGSGTIGSSGGGFAGDGGQAKQALLKNPTGVALDGSGNLFFTDAGNLRVRRIDARTGILTTVAGNGGFGFDGDGKPATTAKLGFLTNLVVDTKGNLYICDQFFGVVRAVKDVAVPSINGPGIGPK